MELIYYSLVHTWQPSVYGVNTGVNAPITCGGRIWIQSHNPDIDIDLDRF